jgi:ABC-type phosphate transport system permease subunit
MRVMRQLLRRGRVVDRSPGVCHKILIKLQFASRDACVRCRYGAVGLGAPKWKVILLICYRAALDGIVTGILLAVSRIAGETAPLLFTSLGNLNWSIGLTKPMASLPVTIYQYAGSAF